MNDLKNISLEYVPKSIDDLLEWVKEKGLLWSTISNLINKGYSYESIKQQLCKEFENVVKKEKIDDQNSHFSPHIIEQLSFLNLQCCLYESQEEPSYWVRFVKDLLQSRYNDHFNEWCFKDTIFYPPYVCQVSEFPKNLVELKIYLQKVPKTELKFFVNNIYQGSLSDDSTLVFLHPITKNKRWHEFEHKNWFKCFAFWLDTIDQTIYVRRKCDPKSVNWYENIKYQIVKTYISDWNTYPKPKKMVLKNDTTQTEPKDLNHLDSFLGKKSPSFLKNLKDCLEKEQCFDSIPTLTRFLSNVQSSIVYFDFNGEPFSEDQNEKMTLLKELRDICVQNLESMYFILFFMIRKMEKHFSKNSIFFSKRKVNS